MEQKENILLKIGSILILAGGLVSGAIAIFNSVATMAAISSLDNSTMAGLEAYVQQESGGAFGADSAVGLVNVVAIVAIGFTVIMMIIDLVVGLMGLSRCKQPKKYKFFLVWGIILLALGLFGLGSLFTLQGTIAALGSIVGPVLFIVGSLQQNKAANAEQTEAQ